MDVSKHPTKRRAQDDRRPLNHRYRYQGLRHKKTSSSSLSPEVLEPRKSTEEETEHKEVFNPVRDGAKTNISPSLLDHDHPSFTDVNLDFRHIIEEIDHAIARNLRTKSRYEVPAQSKKRLPKPLSRQTKSSQSPDSNLAKDELFQYISNLPLESSPPRPVLAIEKVTGVSIVPVQMDPVMTQTSLDLQKRRNIGSQTEEKQWNPTVPPWQMWIGPSSPYQTWSSPYPRSDRFSSPEPRRRPVKKRQKSKQTSSRGKKSEIGLQEAANLRESAELASIRALLLSPGQQKLQRKPGEIVMISDGPTLSLSEIFETKKKSLLLKMQARDSSIPVHSDPVPLSKDALLKQRETLRQKRQSQSRRKSP